MNIAKIEDERNGNSTGINASSNSNFYLKKNRIFKILF